MSPARSVTLRNPLPFVVMLLGIVAICSANWSLASEHASEEETGAVFVLPFEVDVDRGAANGDAVISRIIPVNTVLIKARWKLVNVGLVTIADAPGGRPGGPSNPEPVPGPKTFGLGDIADALLYTPRRKGLQWGVGAFFGFPTATDDVLGSGKWSAGPAVRLGYRTGAWRLGLLAGTRWSFAGDSDRADVSQLLVRGLVHRTLPRSWFFVSAPIITANWNASSSERWLVPLGGGFGYSFKFKPTRLNVSLQAYVNAVKPDGAPDKVFRLEVVVPFRVPGGASRRPEAIGTSN